MITENKERLIEIILSVRPDAISAGYEDPKYQEHYIFIPGTEKELQDYTLEELDKFRVALIDHIVCTNYNWGGIPEGYKLERNVLRKI
ncbi:MAG: hypothetical protein VW518_05840 [Burkholderiaceae bacterium]